MTITPVNSLSVEAVIVSNNNLLRHSSTVHRYESLLERSEQDGLRSCKVVLQLRA